MHRHQQPQRSGNLGHPDGERRPSRHSNALALGDSLLSFRFP
jgi:hypothetical protein